MPNTLMEPEYYMPVLRKLRTVDKYASTWALRVERHTNRHTDGNNQYWGWYEVHPLGKTVGIWSSSQDDMRGIDLTHWNLHAEELSMNDISVDPDYTGEVIDEPQKEEWPWP